MPISIGPSPLYPPLGAQPTGSHRTGATNLEPTPGANPLGPTNNLPGVYRPTPLGELILRAHPFGAHNLPPLSPLPLRPTFTSLGPTTTRSHSLGVQPLGPTPIGHTLPVPTPQGLTNLGPTHFGPRFFLCPPRGPSPPHLHSGAHPLEPKPLGPTSCASTLGPGPCPTPVERTHWGPSLYPPSPLPRGLPSKAQLSLGPPP